MKRLPWELAALGAILAAGVGLSIYDRATAKAADEMRPCSAVPAVDAPRPELIEAGTFEAPRPELVEAETSEAKEETVVSEVRGAPEIAPSEFESLTAKGFAVVTFTAEWCPACRTMAPVVDRLADEYRGKILIGKLNVDAPGAREVAGRFGIRGIPTLVFLRDGRETDRTVGVVGEADLRAAIDSEAAKL